MTLEAGNKDINGDIFSCRTQLFVFEEDVKENIESSRIKTVSQTHAICNLVCICLLKQFLKVLPAAHSGYI
jgi:hypothetical protein